MGRRERKQLSNRDLVIDLAVFAVLLIIASTFILELLNKQTAVISNGSDSAVYESDMAAYILEMQGMNSKYSFPYPVYFKTAAFINLFATPELSVSLAAVLFNALGIVIVKVMLNRFVRKECTAGLEGERSFWPQGILTSLLAVSLFFISMLFPPKGIYLPGIRFTYLGVFTANPYHNATYVSARPFAILAFLWYAKLLPLYERGVGKKAEGDTGEPPGISDYVLFSVFLLVATLTKPSFTLVLVGTAGVIMLFRLFHSKFRNFVPTLQLSLCFVPTFVALLYQYSGVFVAKEGADGGIGFTFGEVWGYYCDIIPLAIGLAIGFPLLVLVLNYKELKKNTFYRLSWQLYLVSFAMAFFLYEKGFRKPDFNFSWGYMYGIFFCHLSALMVLLKKTFLTDSKGAPAQREGKKIVWNRLLLSAQWLAYIWHVMCGLYYFWEIWNGKSYY